MDNVKQYTAMIGGPFVALCIIAIIIIFVVMPFGFPCTYEPFDWYNQCKPPVIKPCEYGQRVGDIGKCVSICQVGQTYINGQCVNQNTICSANQTLTNGLCVDKMEYPLGAPIDSIKDTTTNPLNPNPNEPNSTSTDSDPNYFIIANPPIPQAPIKLDPSISSLLMPDITTKVIRNYNYPTQVAGWSYLQSVIKDIDHITEVTITPKKNPAYQGICKTVVSHASLGSGVQLNAIGRTPPTAPASGDDMRPMSYYVWGVGKHIFSVIDKNSAMNYRIDTTMSFT